VLKKEGLEEAKINQALESLLVARKNEFRELSNMVLPKTQSEPVKNWEQFVMNFCLDVNEAFKTWSGDMELNSQKALTILRQLSRDKTSMTQLSHLMNISYDLAEEFKEIYRRL
jgi:hypothetical protein